MDKTVCEIAEECSRASGGVDELSLLHLRPYLEGFLDSNWLDKKLKEYDSWASKNSDPTLQRNILHRPIGMNMLIAIIWAARSWEELYLDDTSFIPTGGAKSLIRIATSLAVLELRAGKHLNSEARKYIQRRLQATDQFWGMVHEMNTFAHFIRRGADVEPRFLKPANPEEIILKWREHSIPVQCKVKQPGAGRLISQDAFTTLAGSIARDAKVAGRKSLVRISSAGPILQHDIDFLRIQISSGAGTSIVPDLVSHNNRVFALMIQPLSGHFTVDSVHDYLSNFNFHIKLIVGDPAPNGVGFNVDSIVAIDTNPDDSLRSWNSLHRSIKRGARQLEGGPPGIVAIHYVDPVIDPETLRPGNQPMISEIARIIKPLPHLKAVMLSSEPNLQLPGSRGVGAVRSYVEESCGFADLLGNLE
jgi:hypothetical protein